MGVADLAETTSYGYNELRIVDIELQRKPTRLRIRVWNFVGLGFLAFSLKQCKTTTLKQKNDNETIWLNVTDTNSHLNYAATVKTAYTA